jgi:hypothetical protein
MAFQRTFMYDGAVSHLDLQPIPLTSEIEKRFKCHSCHDEKDKTYRELFKVSLMTVPFLLRTCSKHFLIYGHADF